MTISILIVNWKSKDHLRRCLHTVRQTCAALAPQVAVVDGGSFDGCDEMIATEFPEVEFVQSMENRGFGQSNNLGFENIRGEVLLLLNPDTELQEGAVAALLTHLESEPQAGLIGPRLLNTDGSLQTSCVQALPTPWNQLLDSEFLRRRFPNWRLWKMRHAFSSHEAVEVEAVSGACMLMPSALFRELGGFAPQYFMYGEDMDLCARVRGAGKKIYHVPKSTVIHHGGGSSSTQASKFATVHFCQSVYLYIRTHHGPFQARIYRTLFLLSAILRLAFLIPCTWFSGSSRRMKSRQKWQTIFRWTLGLESWACPPARAAKLQEPAGRSLQGVI
jgi:N-acetylglucosaminyl-diphospho-decaprenol L-rhamnosyltransferase